MEKTVEKEKLFSKNFILTSLSTFTLFSSFYFLLITLPIYIQKIGGTESEIGLIIGVFTISAVLLRPFIGKEVDRRGRKIILISGIVIFLISMILYDYTKNVTSLLLLRVLHGITGKDIFHRYSSAWDPDEMTLTTRLQILIAFVMTRNTWRLRNSPFLWGGCEK